MSKDESATFNTAFVVLDSADLDAFLDVAFRSLKREAKKIINSTGTYSIIVDIKAVKTNEAKAHALQLEEVK